jgi:hypothetical protein
VYFERESRPPLRVKCETLINDISKFFAHSGELGCVFTLLDRWPCDCGETELKGCLMEPRPTEDQFTKTIESYTAAVPSTGYLAVAIGAMGLSLACQVAGRGKWGNFIAQWVPTWLVIGLYNKLVKLEGHDRYDRGAR